MYNPGLTNKRYKRRGGRRTMITTVNGEPLPLGKYVVSLDLNGHDAYIYRFDETNSDLRGELISTTGWKKAAYWIQRKHREPLEHLPGVQFLVTQGPTDKNPSTGSKEDA